MPACAYPHADRQYSDEGMEAYLQDYFQSNKENQRLPFMPESSQADVIKRYNTYEPFACQ